jgi:hypothetical protein
MESRRRQHASVPGPTPHCFGCVVSQQLLTASATTVKSSSAMYMYILLWIEVYHSQDEYEWYSQPANEKSTRRGLNE